MHVIFNHGKESGPWGTKIKALAAAAEALGCTVESIDYQNEMDADRRVNMLLQTLSQTSDDVVLVGSSMGGYVATVAASQHACTGLFVMAPAYYLGGYTNLDDVQLRCPVSIVHGWQDEVVPVQNSWRFAQRIDADLHLLKDDHRLIETLPHTVMLFKGFLTDCMGRS